MLDRLSDSGYLTHESLVAAMGDRNEWPYFFITSGRPLTVGQKELLKIIGVPEGTGTIRLGGPATCDGNCPLGLNGRKAYGNDRRGSPSGTCMDYNYHCRFKAWGIGEVFVIDILPDISNSRAPPCSDKPSKRD